MATSYNGWPAARNPSDIGINRDWAPLGHKFPGGIKSGPVEVVMTWVVEQLHARVEKIDRDAIKDEWGYVYKQSANSPKLVSCHASGTAFDYNASRHPNGKRGTFTPAQAQEIRRVCDEAGVVRWLGDAKGTPDEMHFEIKGNEAQVAAAAIRLLSKPAPTPDPEDDMQFQVYEITGSHPDNKAAWLVSPGCRPWQIDSPSRRDALTAAHGPAKKVSAEAWDGMKNALPENRG